MSENTDSNASEAAKIEYLLQELRARDVRIEHLEKELAVNALIRFFTGPGAGDFEALKLAALPEYTQIADLNVKIVWLTDKFTLSRKFPLFGEAILAVDHKNPHEIKGDVWREYLAAIGVHSMKEVLDAAWEGRHLLGSLPLELRQFFPAPIAFEEYFRQVIRALDSIGELPVEDLRAYANAVAENRALGAYSEEALELLPQDARYPGFLRGCRARAGNLAREILAANARLQNVFALVLAVLPGENGTD